MKARGKVKGILVEGSDGHEYLLGFGPGEEDRAPMVSPRDIPAGAHLANLAS
jgi:hypothetical protein